MAKMVTYRSWCGFPHGMISVYALILGVSCCLLLISSSWGCYFTEVDFVFVRDDALRYQEIGSMTMGLFTFEDKAEMKYTCRSFSSEQVDSFDKAFQLARLFSIIASVCIAIGMVAVVALSSFAAKRGLVRFVGTVLLVGSVFDALTFRLFKSEICTDCSFFYGASLTAVCAAVTMTNAILVFNYPTPLDDKDPDLQDVEFGIGEVDPSDIQKGPSSPSMNSRNINSPADKDVSSTDSSNNSVELTSGNQFVTTNDVNGGDSVEVLSMSGVSTQKNNVQKSSENKGVVTPVKPGQNSSRSAAGRSDGSRGQITGTAGEKGNSKGSPASSSCHDMLAQDINDMLQQKRKPLDPSGRSFAGGCVQGAMKTGEECNEGMGRFMDMCQPGGPADASRPNLKTAAYGNSQLASGAGNNIGKNSQFGSGAGNNLKTLSSGDYESIGSSRQLRPRQLATTSELTADTEPSDVQKPQARGWFLGKFRSQNSPQKLAPGTKTEEAMQLHDGRSLLVKTMVNPDGSRTVEETLIGG